jgi:2,4-dienoyl-CoA reductase-like NADH-dependent reductase (Old Yellow Enzyme family)
MSDTAWTSLRLRDVTVPNRVWLSPMCQYSADSAGAPTDWHLAHYASRAAGGVGLVMVECTGVAPDMRTTTRDLGLYTREQVAGHRRLAVAASGAITEPHHLDEAVPNLVDAVLVGRAMLRDPYWALRARGADPLESWPKQYHRAF